MRESTVGRTYSVLPENAEADQIAVIGNLHMITRVIKAADFKSEVKFDL